MGNGQKAAGQSPGKCGDALAIEVHIVRMDHDQRLLDSRMTEERLQSTGQNGLSAQGSVLLGNSLTCSRSTSCCDDEGGD
jgi:hypothetical protein